MTRCRSLAAPRSSPAPARGLGCAIARAYVEAGASVLLCARDAGVLAGAAEVRRAGGPGQKVVARARRRLAAGPTSTAGRARRRKLSASARPGQQRRRLRPDRDRSRRSTGRRGSARSRSTSTGRSCCAARSCRTSSGSGYGKIIKLSGGGATNPLPRISAYAASKAAVVRFAETLAEVEEAASTSTPSRRAR